MMLEDASEIELMKDTSELAMIGCELYFWEIRFCYNRTALLWYCKIKQPNKQSEYAMLYSAVLWQLKQINTKVYIVLTH